MRTHEEERRQEEADHAQLTRLRVETDQAIEDLSEHPTGAEIGKLFKHFRLEYATHANINAHRIDATLGELRLVRRIVTAGLVVLAALLIAAGIIGLGYQSSNTHALCSFRNDLQQRVDATHRFLKDHPSGIPGVPVKLLQSQLDGQQRTIVALGSLHCGLPS